MGVKKEVDSGTIIDKAKAFGADLAGIAQVADLKESPSHWFCEIMQDLGVIETHQTGRLRCGIVKWPEEAESAIVLAITHPEDRPELDWWRQSGNAGGTMGDRLLMDIMGKLAGWLEKNTEMRCSPLPYHVEKGGIYLKDAAVMAGLGCIGMNNLLITPKYGPRQRIRAMLVDAVLPPTGPIDFDPCKRCDMPCRKVCPQKAFDCIVYLPAAYEKATLPGRTGVYDRSCCDGQMLIDEANIETVADEGQGTVERRVKYCRRCELACPVGLCS